MIKVLKERLKEEHAGFSGVTHWLIAVCLFFLMWLLPIAWSQNYVAEVGKSGLFAFIVFLVVGGASLLPDLDSSPLQEGGSTAVYQLGFLGQLLSLGCITISGVIWSVLHTSQDQKPPSQHRMLFHAPVVGLSVFLLNQFAYPASENCASDVGFNKIPFTVYMVLFLGAVSIYLGASMFFYRVLSLIHKQKHTQIFCWIFMLLGLWQMWTMPWYRLKLVGSGVALGYLFHILGDMFSKGSAPLFFPIPTPVKTGKGIKWRLWWKPYPFGGKFAIETGGAINTILNFLLIGVDLALAWFIFIR